MLAVTKDTRTGKDPRIKMDEHVVHEKKDNVTVSEVDAYSYSACLRWCKKYMSEPSENNKHRGTWGANGAYIWDGRSNGSDENPYEVEVLDQRPVGFKGIDGSNELYSYRAWNTTHVPEIETQFVPCHCCCCRSGEQASCPYRNITGPLGYAVVPQLRVAEGRRGSRRRRGAAPDADDEDDEWGRS